MYRTRLILQIAAPGLTRVPPALTLFLRSKAHGAGGADQNLAR
jgi:hypothetical protein